MKKNEILFLCLCLIACLQTHSQNPYKTNFVKQGSYLMPYAVNEDVTFYGDSLNGFKEESIRAELVAKGVVNPELSAHIKVLKRRYIDTKYQLKKENQNSVPQPGTIRPGKLVGHGAVINSTPCINEGFESTPAGAYTASNAVAGWTLTSGTKSGCGEPSFSAGATEFTIATTPFSGFPGIGTVPNSPLGGSNVACLNNYVNNYSMTKLATTFPVTSSNNIFKFAYAGYFQNSDCCDGSGLYTKLYDCNNNPIACGIFTLGPGCNNAGTSFTTSGGYYTSWQVKTIDLSPLIGTCVTFEIWCTDNTFGGSYGCALFDASCENGLLPGFSQVGPPSQGINFCQGSGAAQLIAPQGYSSYSWTASSSLTPVSAAQASLASITITNPVAGGVYTLVASNSSVCSTLKIYTLTPTQVSVYGTGSAPTCSVGTSGSASVQANGSSVGYNYVWTNQTNSVVGTASVVTGLSPGIYSVTVSASNNTACGVSSTTVAVVTGTVPPNYATQSFCGSTVYFPAYSGSNFQWYSGSTAITGTAGVAAAYTATGVTSTSIFRLGRIYFGCRDSTIFALNAISPGTLQTSVSGASCFGTSGASAQINFTPVAIASGSNNSYTVQSIGSSTPAYLSSSVALGASPYTIQNLVSGTSYSVSIFDGACMTSTYFPVSPITPSFAAIAGPPNAVVCNGDNLTLFCAGSALSLADYTYSWSPSPLFPASSTTLHQIVISPTTSPGTTATAVFTVVITPTIANCPVSTTFAITYANPLTPTLSAPSSFCKNDPSYTISATPGGGSFSIGSFSSGVISPSLTTVGVHTLGYSADLLGCVASTSLAFTIYALPTVAVTGNFSICSGSPTTLTASGAATYTWSNLQTGAMLTVSPVQTSTYSVTGEIIPGNCTATKTLTVITMSLPTISFGGRLKICAGETSTITVSSAGTFTWDNGSTALTQIVSPTLTTIYSVTATDPLNGCENTSTVSLVVNKCTGIAEEKATMSLIRVFPNPVSGNFTIESDEPVDISIVNGLGQIIYSKKIVTRLTTIDFSGFSNGVYYIKSFRANSESIIKMIKID